jgi:hypothetical protein
MKDKGKKIRIALLVSVLACIFAGLGLTIATDKAQEAGPCDNRQWESSKEELDCRFPPPPIGRWHAVYTEEFAKEHNLPPENISTDLSPGVDYMEMDVQPYGNGGTACLVNMLIRKPNDVAVYNKGEEYQWGPELHAHRKLAHFIDLDAHKDKLRRITTFGFTTRDNPYDPNRSYTIGSSFAFHAEYILDGYDYITANASCYHIVAYPKPFPDGWAFNYAKASVWGHHEASYKYMDQPGRPKGKDFYDSRISINIPRELISTVFKDMPIGGR